MKYVFSIVAAALAISSAFWPAPATGQDAKLVAEYEDPKIVSYVVGGNIGDNLRRNDFEVDLDEFSEGLKQAFKGEDLKYTEESRTEILRAFSKEKQLPKSVVNKIVSYLMGGDVGANLKQSAMEIRVEEFLEGVNLAFHEKELRYSREERSQIMNAVANHH